MSTETKVNLCAESGCIGGCCTDMEFDNVTSRQVKLLTPKGTKVVRVSHKATADTEKMFEDYPPTEGTTVYVAGRGRLRRHKVIVKGPCANLSPNGDCRIYRFRPPHCRDFLIKSEECNDIRTDKGLPLFPTISVRPQ